MSFFWRKEKKQEQSADLVQIEKNLARLERGIHEDLTRIQELNKLSRKCVVGAFVCMGALVVIKAPVVLLGALACAGAAGVCAVVSAVKDRALNDKYEAQANLTLAKELALKTREQASALLSGTGREFDDAARIRALEETVADLKEQLEEKPVEIVKPRLQKGPEL